jgi:hypothetical protein
MKKNLLHIDEIRFLIIHIILINHWSANLAIVDAPFNRDAIYFWIDLTSPCLALISGYLFFYRSKQHFDFKKKVRTRFHSLVIPYIIWSVSFFLIYELLKTSFEHLFHVTYWYKPTQPFTLKSMVADLVNPPLANFWYLQNLIFIIPFNFIIYFLLKNKYVFIAILTAVIAIYSFNLTDLFFQSRFLPYYLLGCFLGYNEIRAPKIPVNKATTFALVPLLAAVAIYTSRWHDEIFPFLILKIAIAVFFLISVFNMLDSNQNSVVFRYLQKYQAYSFFLFAINMFLFCLVQRISFKLGAAQLLRYEVFLFSFLVASAILVVIIAFTLAGFLKNRFSKFFYVVTGR